MNLKKVKFSTLLLWKNNEDFPSIFVKEIVKELKKRQAKIKRLSEKDKIKLALELVKKGAVQGRESVDDAEIALKVVGLPKTKTNFCAVYNKAFGPLEKDFWDSLSVDFKKKFRK